ncbi:MAG: DNA topoisomerase I, partial [Rikenellaceae bacterium]|nr:DNA topoisomerase I [Rikenellaceae bacterium]
GIGRPSTYAPTIYTVINRGYVVRESREGQPREYLKLKLTSGKITEKTATENHGTEKNKLFPTDIGIVVTDYLEGQFSAILDYNFTATVEKEFDEIAEGQLQWTQMIAKFYGDFHPTVETALTAEHANSTRELGTDPHTGLAVYAKIGRFGPYVQLGENEDIAGKKPQYANLAAGQLIATITLQEALELFKLPRTVGSYEEKDVVIGVGRFGPYVRHDGKFVSLKKTDDPYTVTLERSIELIEEKRRQERERVIKIFAEDPELQVLNGRWGPYLCKGKTNYKLPKGTDAPNLTFEQAQQIMADQPDKKPAKTAARGKRTAKK